MEVALSARLDIAAVLEWSDHRFGPAARARYARLIERGMQDISAAEGPPMRRHVDAPGGDFRILHLKYCRQQGADRVARPRHMLVYRVVSPERILLLRLLHDTMHLPSALSEEE